MQPFIPLARALKAHGHRVRLASHAVYRCVRDARGRCPGPAAFFPLPPPPCWPLPTSLRCPPALHPIHRKWVESFGVEFYPLGGDPEVHYPIIPYRPLRRPPTLSPALGGAPVSAALTKLATCPPCRPAAPAAPPRTPCVQVLSKFIVQNRGVLPKMSEIPLALDSTEQVGGGWGRCCSPAGRDGGAAADVAAPALSAPRPLALPPPMRATLRAAA